MGGEFGDPGGQSLSDFGYIASAGGRDPPGLAHESVNGPQFPGQHIAEFLRIFDIEPDIVRHVTYFSAKSNGTDRAGYWYRGGYHK